MDQIHAAFSANVRLLRDKRGWSQEDLAEKSGLHRTYISGIERGVRNPTLGIIDRLAKALGVPPSELLKRRSE
jgi:transcriptional regulator with XRE-family HTH domain